MKLLRKMIVIHFIVLISFYGCQKTDPPTKPPVVTLPDTTSHDFTWQIDVLGDGNASRLRDVCIIDENDVWAVGEIYVKDSTGAFSDTYNVIHWNGSEWDLIRIRFPICGTNDTAPFPARAVLAFDPSHIWFTSAGTIYYLNGTSISKMCIPSDLLPGSINKLWGDSQNNVYVVGNKGTIVHYNGTSWQKIESGTDLDIQDIWGGTDPITGEDIILAVAGNIYTTYDKEILKINGTTVAKLTTEGIDWPLDAVWFDPGQIYYVVGAGIYSKKSLDNTVSWNGPGLTATSYSSYAIRGNYINDVFVTGAFGDVLHFNGNSWRSYREHTALLAGSYRAVAVKGDLMFAVGSEYDKAVILRGKRK